MPQFQPARAVLFITTLAGLLGSAAAWRAASGKRWWEAAAWFALVFAIPVNGLVAQLFYGGNWPRLATVALLTALATLAAAQPRAALPVALSAFFLIPGLAGVKPFPPLHTSDLHSLSSWARSATPRDSVFVFPDSGRGLAPGVFRALSLRALFVDWKSGGQANLLQDYGYLWWQRWSAIHRAEPPLRPLSSYRALGIDYLVVQPARKPPGSVPVFENAGWSVLDLNAIRRETAPPPPAQESTPAPPGA